MRGIVLSALLAADHQTLATILADDFVIVDVMSGQAARREDLLGAISSGELQFADVRQYTEERTVRHRNSLAVVIGQTPRRHGAAVRLVPCGRASAFRRGEQQVDVLEGDRPHAGREVRRDVIVVPGLVGFP